MWDTVTREIGEARERELPSRLFKLALANGAQMDRHLNAVQSAHDIIRRITKSRSAVSPIQRELVDEREEIIDTATGESLNQELKELVRRNKVELRDLRGEVGQALWAKDEERRQELEEAKRELQEKIEEIKKATERMATNYAVEKERMAAKMKAMEQGSRKDRLRVEADLIDISRRLQDTTNVFTADQARVEKGAEEERQRTEAELANLGRRLQDAIDASAVDRAKLEQEVKAREQADAERKQLADLARRLQDEIAVSVTHRTRLEQEMKKLQELAAAMPSPVPPRQVLYVRVLFCPATYDG